MKNKNLRNYIITSSLFLIFVIFTLLVKFVDVSKIGPMESEVGFSKINEFVFNSIPSFTICDLFSDLILFGSLALVGLYMVLGIVQAVKRKNLFKVDPEIKSFAIVVLLIICSYILFEFITINHRPILEDGKLAVSYPSTHTLLSLSILGCTLINLPYLIKNKNLKICGVIAISIIMTATVVLRLFAGVHWLTDIIGGIILSLAITYFFYTLKTKLTPSN